jgi:hypothetical protein
MARRYVNPTGNRTVLLSSSKWVVAVESGNAVVAYYHWEPGSTTGLVMSGEMWDATIFHTMQDAMTHMIRAGALAHMVFESYVVRLVWIQMRGVISE